MRVGIVGGGRMGLWLKREIAKLYQTAVYDLDRSRSDVETLDGLVASSDVIIVAVGFREAGDVIRVALRAGSLREAGPGYSHV
jgi:hypothetical protein